MNVFLPPRQGFAAQQLVRQQSQAKTLPFDGTVVLSGHWLPLCHPRYLAPQTSISLRAV